MKCLFCGTETRKDKVTFVYEDNEKSLFVENVPAEVCVKCGEKTYSPEVTDKLMKYSDRKIKPVKTLKIPGYEFANIGCNDKV